MKKIPIFTPETVFKSISREHGHAQKRTECKGQRDGRCHMPHDFTPSFRIGRISNICRECRCIKSNSQTVEKPNGYQINEVGGHKIKQRDSKKEKRSGGKGYFPAEIVCYEP